MLRTTALALAVIAPTMASAYEATADQVAASTAYMQCNDKAARDLAAQDDDPVRLGIVAEWSCRDPRKTLQKTMYESIPATKVPAIMDSLRKIQALHNANTIKDTRAGY